MRSQMQTDKPLTRLTHGGSDENIWNSYLEEVTKAFEAENPGEKPSWFKVSWLYYECYAYRRVNDCIRAR